jgi:hypothetical protein
MGRRHEELARKLQLVLAIENAGSNTGMRVGVRVARSESLTSLICAGGIRFAKRRFLQRLLHRDNTKGSIPLTWLTLGAPSPAPIPECE